MSTPIDDLFAEAARAMPAKRKAASPPARAAPEAPSALFTNPANWQRIRAVALIHAESETVLGVFGEYTHRTARGCRRLVREEALTAVSATERVSGSWWLGDAPRPEPRRDWHEERGAIVHLHLPALGVHAPATEVTAFLSFGGIARVELAQPTRLASEHGDTLLDLPAGTNVLDVMSLDSKMSLRRELGI